MELELKDFRNRGLSLYVRTDWLRQEQQLQFGGTDAPMRGKTLVQHESFTLFLSGICCRRELVRSSS
jgi:hypothetical protein